MSKIIVVCTGESEAISSAYTQLSTLFSIVKAEKNKYRSAVRFIEEFIANSTAEILFLTGMDRMLGRKLGDDTSELLIQLEFYKNQQGYSVGGLEREGISIETLLSNLSGKVM